MEKYNKFEEGDLLILKKGKEYDRLTIKECKIIHVILNKPDEDGTFSLDNDYYNIEYNVEHGIGEKVQNWMDMGFIHYAFEIDIKKLRKEKLYNVSKKVS